MAININNVLKTISAWNNAGKDFPWAKNKMLEKNSSIEYLFGNDGDDMRSPGKGIDPRINTSDMSNNPVDYAKDRIILSQYLIPKLYKTLSTKSNSWESIYQGYRILLRQIHTSAEIISRQVGGVYVSRGFMKEDSESPYNVVPYEVQKKSIQILSEYYFDSSNLIVPADIASKMQRERRSFDFFGKTEDPKIHSMILKGQKRVIKHFTNSRVLKRLTDSSLYGNKYLPSELLDDLTSSIFNQNKSRILNGIDQNLQSYFVKRLIMILKSGSFDSPSISASFSSLEKIKAYTFSPCEDKATENHKKFLRYQIKNIGFDGSGINSSITNKLGPSPLTNLFFWVSRVATKKDAFGLKTKNISTKSGSKPACFQRSSNSGVHEACFSFTCIRWRFRSRARLLFLQFREEIATASIPKQ